MAGSQVRCTQPAPLAPRSHRTFSLRSCGPQMVPSRRRIAVPGVVVRRRMTWLVSLTLMVAEVLVRASVLVDAGQRRSPSDGPAAARGGPPTAQLVPTDYEMLARRHDWVRRLRPVGYLSVPPILNCRWPAGDAFARKTPPACRPTSWFGNDGGGTFSTAVRPTGFVTMAQVEANPFFRQVETGAGSETDLTSRAFRVAVLSAQLVHGTPPRVPGQPVHAPAVTVKRPNELRHPGAVGPGSERPWSEHDTARNARCPKPASCGPGRWPWRAAGSGPGGTPTLPIGWRRAYPLSGWTLTIVCLYPSEGLPWRDRTCLPLRRRLLARHPRRPLRAAARPGRSLSGHPLTGAKSRTCRPASRVAAGHREATRSALDGGRCVWTISTRRGGHDRDPAGRATAEPPRSSGAT